MKLKIIALPAEDRTMIIDGLSGYEYSDDGHPYKGEFYHKCQHLYMLAPDAEIRFNDWISFDTEYGSYTVELADSSWNISQDTDFSKIIMATDPSLNLPIIPEFICREFCESENRSRL